jgi:hypothetical protein
MKLQLAVLLATCLTFNLGCAKPPENVEAPQPIQTPEPIPLETSIPVIEVMGQTASFGSHCPFGTYSPPSAVPIELHDCPLGQPSIELVEPLQPILFLVDCKKKTIDIRGTERAHGASSWEFLPDGSFQFGFKGGTAKIKQNAAEESCMTPLRGAMRGRIDCSNMDHAVISVQTVWWLGETYDEPAPAPSVEPTPIPSFIATPTPSASTIPMPVPAPSESPIPSASGLANGIRHLSEALWFNPAPVPTPDPSPSRIPRSKACKLPPGCYFQTITQVKQCS